MQVWFCGLSESVCMFCIVFSAFVYLLDVDGVARLEAAHSPILKQTLAGLSSAETLDTVASSPSYPSSPDLSSPRPCGSSADPDPNLDPVALRQQLQQLRSQLDNQHRVIQHLQQLLRKTSLPAEDLCVTPELSGREEGEEDRQATRVQIARLEREQTMNRSQSASPSKYEKNLYIPSSIANVIQ